ncbi:MAG: glycosyltransferase [Bacteroidetes bacterium]|jgi:glycosyltransferase involved in cell wall biosynthesis|nr:glycosyltransferase [Bacteroidota bacterium]
MSLRVLHVIARFSAPSETFVYATLKAQRSAGLDVHVATFDRNEIEDRPFEDVHSLPLRSIWHPGRLLGRVGAAVGIRHRETYTWPDLRGKLALLIDRLQPDVLHAHFGPMGVFSAPVATSKDVPLLTSFYGFDASQRAEDRFWRRKYSGLWDEGDLFQALSEEMKDRLVALGAPERNVRVVHLARDLDTFRYRDPGWPVRDLLCVARMTPKKGHIDLLQAVAQARSEVPDLTLRLVGDGPLRPRIERTIEDLDLSGTVELTGWQRSEDVRRQLDASDAFVLCSKVAPGGDREGTPTVLVEAQAVGLPVVATRHAGIPEMVPADNHHLLAPEGEPEDIAERILRLCRASGGEVKRIARAGRANIEKNFNLKRETDRLVRLYQELLPDTL